MPNVQKNIKFHTEAHGWLVHPDLRTRLVADAEERGTTVGDLVNEILAKRVGIPFEAKQRRSTPASDDKEQLTWRMPEELLRVLAAVFPVNWADGVRAALCAHYDLPAPPRPKSTRQRRAAA